MAERQQSRQPQDATAQDKAAQEQAQKAHADRVAREQAAREQAQKDEAARLDREHAEMLKADAQAQAEQRQTQDQTIQGAPRTPEGRRVQVEDVQTPEPANPTPEDTHMVYPEERTAARQDREQREAAEATAGPVQGAVQSPMRHDMPPLTATQEAVVGERVMLNAHQFDWGTALPSVYAWRLVAPNGEPADLTNPHMPGPSFVPHAPGAYRALIGTPHGEAIVTINVAER